MTEHQAASDGDESWHESWRVDRQRSIKLQVYRFLRQAIVDARLAPGRALSEKELAQRLGVSRTPAREALSKLADDGLVTILPQAGTFVAPLSFAGVVDAQYLREVLECAGAAELAQTIRPEDAMALDRIIDAQKSAAATGDLALFHAQDEAFHKHLTVLAGHPSVWPVIDQAKTQLDRVRRLSLPDAGRPAVAIRQHEAVVAALRAHDGPAASRAMGQHLREVLKILDDLHARAPALFLPGGGTAPKATPARRRGALRDGFRFGP